MKYAVITSKHHDGFCLFDSQYTDYDAVNTPYGKYLIKEWVEAFRAEGLGVGFYYSLIDWHHPDFTVDRHHPQRTDDPEERAILNEGRDMSVYRQYLRDQIRNRIIQENDQYKVLDTDYVFTEKEILDELKTHPERFSPNVVLRPLYQELVLPNLAYIGGGGEIAYWLERKEQFEHFGINFPMLIRRNSVLWIDKNSQNKISGISIDYLIKPSCLR